MSKSVSFTDVIGTVIHIVPDEQAEVILNLTDEQRRYTKLFANTIKMPHEIFKFWRRDPNNSDAWILIRAYIQVLDLSETEVAIPFAISVVEFVWKKRWKIYSMHMMTGEQIQVTDEINQTVRFGERLFIKD